MTFTVDIVLGNYCHVFKTNSVSTKNAVRSQSYL